MKYPQVVSLPAVVSDWLEEQLEARGIDAVVYTRYIISLLSTHTIDVIYPDDEVQFSRLSKDVRSQKRRCGRKRICNSSLSCASTPSSSDWWKYTHVDAERIKRSAAVECLMSSSDQNCEIESLVDELCEKLKQVKSSTSSPLLLPTATNTTVENISSQEQAEKYYAAFPLLKSHTSEDKPSTLIPIRSKWNQQLSSHKNKKGPKKKYTKKQSKYEAKLHHKVNGESAMKARQGKHRFSFLSRNKNMNANVRKYENLSDWDMNILNNNNKTQVTKKCEKPDMNEESYDQCITGEWGNDNEMNMYDDLPVDIQDLLDSPNPKDKTIEWMNLANMKNNGKSSFIPYGANIISSIWSNEQDVINDNDINAAIDSESLLDFKFSSISIDSRKEKLGTDWPNFEKSATISDNETNSFFESNRCRRNLWPMDGFRSLPGDWKKSSENVEKEQLDEMMNLLSKSLMKLNHSKESSCFTEILPKSYIPKEAQSFNPFGRSTSMFSFHSQSGIFDREEDLLTSERSHFKPITEKLENSTQKQYADGATFMISNNLEKVDYKRSESGTMWLETGYGQGKKYLEYKAEDAIDSSSPDMEFVLKFSICQNDKACQTEDYLDDNSKIEHQEFLSHVESADTIDHSSPAFETTCKVEEEFRCSCPTISSNGESFCPIHRPQRPESVLGELLWKYDLKSCEKCNRKQPNNVVKWNTVNNWSADVSHSEWENENLRNNLRNIWNGGEVCQFCLKSEVAGTKAAPGSPRSIQIMQLREDISQDGEQLLSDLKNIQKSYMEDLPLVEMSCDISKLLNSTPKERKRRHSFLSDDQEWSFASRLEEDCLCLIQMSTLPVLRSITL